MKVATGVVGLLFLVSRSTFASEPLDTNIDLSKPLFSMDPKAYCVKDANGNYVGEFVESHGEGKDSTREFVWGQGGGCIVRPIRESWAVAHNLDAMVWIGISEWTNTILPPVKGATHQYQIRYVVKDIITVKWVMNWHHALLAGDFQAPKQVVVNYQKTSGTGYIPYWEGSILLEELAPGVTAFAMRNQIEASRTSAEDAAETVRTYFQRMRTEKPNWNPLP